MRELSCQVSAKYSPDNVGLFPFKKRLEAAALKVAYPVGDSIIDYALGFAVTVPSEGETPFHLTELDFLQTVARSDIQIMYNVWAMRDGYVGESTAIETAYALMLGKPVVSVREIASYSPDLSTEISQLLDAHREEILMLPLDVMEPLDINTHLSEWVDAHRDTPGLASTEVDSLMRQVALLTSKYQMTWLEYERLRPLVNGTRRNEVASD